MRLQQEEAQGLQQAAMVLQKQLADQAEKTNRLSTQLHDAKATITQHEIYESVRTESARNERSRVSAEQIQQQSLLLTEGITAGGILKPDHPTKPLQTMSAREAGLVSEIESQIDSDKQWIFKLNREHWREHLPNGWSTSDPLHPALETLLH